MRDRVLRLSMVRAALRWAGFDSLDAYRAAIPEQLARLNAHAVTVRRLVGEGHPDVLAAVFAPPSWHAARLAADPADRVLVIDGQVPVRYRADDPDSERRAWAALAVRASARHDGVTGTGGVDAGCGRLRARASDCGERHPFHRGGTPGSRP